MTKRLGSNDVTRISAGIHAGGERYPECEDGKDRKKEHRAGHTNVATRIHKSFYWLARD